MSWLDIVIIVVIGISVFNGLRTGLIKMLFTVAGIFLGIFLAGRFSDDFAGVLTFIPDDWSKIAAFAIILVAVMVVAWILGTILSKLISLVLLGWVNRLAGAVLGLFVGALLCGAVLSIWVKYLGIGDSVAGSALANFLLDKFPIVLGLLPSEFDSVRDFFN
jgi:membrane protein required for colicin V production